MLYVPIALGLHFVQIKNLLHKPLKYREKNWNCKYNVLNYYIYVENKTQAHNYTSFDIILLQFTK